MFELDHFKHHLYVSTYKYILYIQNRRRKVFSIEVTTQEVLCVEEENKAAKVSELIADIKLYDEKVNCKLYIESELNIEG